MLLGAGLASFICQGEGRRPSPQGWGVRCCGMAESPVPPLPRGRCSVSSGAVGEKQLLDQRGCAAPRTNPRASRSVQKDRVMCPVP